MIDTLGCLSANASALERVHYFPRQLITADDMTAEQKYFRQRLRLHNRYLHGWGVVCGCEVQPVQDPDRPWLIQVNPGYVLTPQGDDIYIGDSITFDLAGDWRSPHDPCATVWPCPPSEIRSSDDNDKVIYVAVRYTECDTRPVRMHPVGCACDEAACAYSRIRDDFELARLWKLPESHENAKKADEQWCEELKKWSVTKPRPVPLCPVCTDEPWVVLASIKVRSENNKPVQLKATDIGYEDRRVLDSVNALHQVLECKAT